MTYRAEHCPCNQPGCRSGNLLPITYGQGVMLMETAEDLARKLNAYESLATTWQKFREQCPLVSLIPGVRYWAFGHFVRGYLEMKT